jgi:hypothetical protein
MVGPLQRLVELADQSDSLAHASYDWLQVGYGIGKVDSALVDGEQVYEEASDPNSDGGNGPIAHFFPDEPLGNNNFESYNTAQTSSAFSDHQTRTLYQGYEGADYLGEAWILNGNSVRLQAALEADSWAAQQVACPTGDPLFGTTGTAGSYNLFTELLIMKGSDGGWHEWTSGSFPNTGNYSVGFPQPSYAVNWAVFQANSS